MPCRTPRRRRQETKEKERQEVEEQESEVKQEVVPVRKLLYSQRSMGARFSDGGLFETLLGQLQRGEVDVMKDDFLVLEAWRDKDGRLVSRNNRRLHCLQRFALKKKRGKREFAVRVNVVPGRHKGRGYAKARVRPMFKAGWHVKKCRSRSKGQWWGRGWCREGAEAVKQEPREDEPEDDWGNWKGA